MAARKHSGPGMTRKEKVEEETLTDEERRDLEQYAEQETGIQNQVKELPDRINMDPRRLERYPDQTLYCLVKRSKAFHEKSGKEGPRGYMLLGDEASGVDERNQPEGLHMVYLPYVIYL